MSFLKNIGTTEVVVVALLVVILFGGKKIPEFVRGLAGAVKEFKKGSKDKTE
jgi:sec-independent protein translocase protein TatA